jgi:flavodoxin I
MPISVRNSYKEMLMNDPNNKVLINLMKNYDIAMLHPNQEDEKNATDFAVEIFHKLIQ